MEWEHFGWGGVGALEPDPLYEPTIIAGIFPLDENTSAVEMTCDHHNYVMYFTNPRVDYPDLEYALDQDFITVEVRMDATYESTKLTAWDLLFSLMSFQDPSIDPNVNWFIGITLWSLIGFCIAATILMIIDSFPLT